MNKKKTKKQLQVVASSSHGQSDRSEILDYVVVGSGASGSMAAQTLVEAGKNVAMIDVGARNPEYDTIVPDKDYISIRKTEVGQHRYFIGDNAEGVVWGDIGKGAQVTPTRKHLTQFVDTYLPIKSDTFSPIESLGYGGLGIGWGLQCWEYSRADIEAAGMDPAKIVPAYETISSRIGISATQDDASKYTMGELKTFQPSATMDRNHVRIYKKYKAGQKGFNKRGIFVGRTPLALLTKDLHGRKKYGYRDMDFYTDRNRSCWRPWITVDELRRKSNFTYIGGHLVTRFSEKKDGTVEISALRTEDNKPVTFRCRKLILAANPISSARIVLRSQGKKGQRVPLLCNPYTYIPCLQPAMVGKAVEPKKLGFAQLTMFLDKKHSNFDMSVASLYSYQSLMLFRIIKQLPLNFDDARIVMRYLMSGLVILGVHHPDKVNEKKFLELEADKNSPTGDHLKASYVLDKADENEYKSREDQCIKAARKMGLFALARINPGYGASVHYAGTLPFSQEEKPFTLSPEGRLHGTQNVYVADSSGFTYLPAKGLTFTLLANAHVTAANILEEEKTMAKSAAKNTNSAQSSNKKQPTVVITGASGFVGTKLVNHFLDQGWKINALVRNAKKYRAKKDVAYFEYDLEKPVDEAAFKGADYLVHTAYVKYDRNHPDAMELNKKAAERLVAASRKYGLKKNVFMSSMSAHDEAKSVYGKQKLAVEEVFNTGGDVNLRFGLILGDGGLVKQMSEHIRTKRIVPLIDGGKQPLQVIGVYDLVRVIQRVIEQGLSGTFTVANPEVVTNKQFYQAVAKRLGVKAIFVPVPFFAILGAMRTINFLRLPLAVNEDNLWGLKMLRSVDNAEDLKKIGIKLDPLDTVLDKPGILAKG